MWEYIQLWFDSIWQLFQIDYPGLGIPIAAVSIGALCAVLGLRVLGNILGFSFSPSSILKDIRGGNNRNIKVPDKRKDDSR